MQTQRRKLLIIVTSLIIVSLGCNLFTPRPPTARPLPTSSILEGTAPAPTPPSNAYGPSFARFQPVAVSVPAQFSGGDYALPLDLGKVQWVSDAELTDAQRSILAQNGFVVLAPEPGRFQEFYQVYESGRYGQRPVFITSDSIYHVYHLIFDKMLRDLEGDSLIATLRTLTSTMLRASYQQYSELKGPALEDPALRNVAFFAVAA